MCCRLYYKLCCCTCRTFKIIDDDGNRSLSLAEFKKGCKDFGLDLEPDVVQQMFTEFDRDHSGSINFDEFLQAIRVCIHVKCVNIFRVKLMSSL